MPLPVLRSHTPGSDEPGRLKPGPVFVASGGVNTRVPLPTLSLGRDVKDEHLNGVAQDLAEDFATGRSAGQGPGDMRPPRHATTTVASVSAQLAIC